MTYVNFLIPVCLMLSVNCFSVEMKGQDPDLKHKAEELISQHGPLRFLENMGQMADQNGKPVPYVFFSATLGNMNLFITKTGYSYVLLKGIKDEDGSESELAIGNKNDGKEHEEEEESKKPKSFEYNRIDVLLKGAEINKNNIIAESGSAEHYNFFYPHCPQGIYGVREYERITVKNVYPNIDWIWYSDNEKGLKYDFIVHPGASPEQIKLVYNYADLSICKTGDLLSLNTPLGKLSEGNLVCYSGERKVESFFQKYENEISLSVSDYDRSHDLIIDPPLALLWSTNYGGAAGVSTSFRSSDVDSQGNLVAVAWATSTLVFPTQSWAGAYFQGTVNGSDDITISKFNNTGARLWATFYGGSGNTIGGNPYGDDVYDVNCDASDNIFVIGYTGSSDFPVQSAFQPASAGGYDMYLIKFNSTGVRQWATYFGGSNSDTGGGITTDAAGNVYIIGVTKVWGGTNIPFKDPGSGAYFQISSGSTNSNDNQQLIAQFDTNGNLLWSTLFGNETNGAADIKIDNSGDIIISGVTNRNAYSQSGQWLPVTNPGGGAYFQPLSGGSTDMYFAKFNTSKVLYWCTYFGGIQDELTWISSKFPFGNFLYIDNCNNVYCIATARNGVPLKDPGNGAFFSSISTIKAGLYAPYQPLLIKFNKQCVLTWSTYLANNTTTNGYAMSGIAICGDINGNLFVVGNLELDHNIPLINPGGGAYFQSTHPSSSRTVGTFGRDDGWIMGFCPNGAMKWASYISTSNNDEMDDFMSVNCDKNGNIFCVGERTGNSNFPCVNPGVGAYFQNTTNGANPGQNDWQGTISKFQAANFICPVFTTTLTSTPSQCGCNATATVSGSNGSPSYTYNWLPGGQTSSTLSGLCPGTYTVIANDAGCEQDTNMIVVSGAGYAMPLTVTKTNSACVPFNGTAYVAATGGNGPYTYNWSNGQSNQTATGLSGGTYTVTVKDVNGCSSFSAVNISQLVIYVSTTTNPTSCNSANGSATAWPGGAPGPYTYSWSNGNTGNNAGNCSTYQGIAYCVSSGTYTVTVTNSNGCSQTATATVPSSPGNNASFVQSPAGTICIGTLVNFTNTGTPPGTGITYNWVISPITPANVSGTTTNFSYTFLTAGTYNIQHTVAGNGCNTIVNSPVTVINCSAGPTVTATGSTVCPGSCGTITSSSTGGAAPYTYSWSNGATTQNISPCPASTTTFTVTIRDAVGNTSTSTAVVVISPAVTVTTTATNIMCSGASTGSATAAGNGGTPGYNYLWSNGGSTSLISNLSPQIYTVTVTDTKGCTAVSTSSVISPPPLTGQFTKGTAVCSVCGCKEWIMVNAAGGTSPYSYTWSDGYVNRYKNQMCSGSYNVNIKDKNGCSVNINLTAP